ncbi:site-specific recombinase XerC [Paraburkholderia sp. RAU6.4a]
MGSIQNREPWNKAKLIGQKPPLKPKDVWAIRIHLQNAHAVRDLALFNLAIDSKLRGCDLVNLHVRDVTHGNQILPLAMIMQSKTKRPVQFEVTEPARTAVAAWIEKAKLRSVPIPESAFSLAAHFNATIRQDGSSVGRCNRS